MVLVNNNHQYAMPACSTFIKILSVYFYIQLRAIKLKKTPYTHYIYHNKIKTSVQYVSPAWLLSFRNSKPNQLNTSYHVYSLFLQPLKVPIQN